MKAIKEGRKRSRYLDGPVGNGMAMPHATTHYNCMTVRDGRGCGTLIQAA